MPEKNTLDPNEFAIRNAATFTFDPTGTSVKIKKNGALTVTLNYTLDNSTNNLQVGPGTITLTDTCGVFKSSAAEEHLKSITATKQPSLTAPAGSTKVQIESGGGDFVLLTDGEKGRQGITVTNALKGEIEKKSK